MKVSVTCIIVVGSGIVLGNVQSCACVLARLLPVGVGKIIFRLLQFIFHTDSLQHTLILFCRDELLLVDSLQSVERNLTLDSYITSAPLFLIS